MDCLKIKSETVHHQFDPHLTSNTERELDLVRGDSPLTIDGSSYVDDDDGSNDNDDDRALFSPTTDEDKHAQERSKEKARQRKLSIAVSDESCSSSQPSKLSDGEGSDGGELKSEKAEAGNAHSTVSLPYYAEPDWGITFCE